MVVFQLQLGSYTSFCFSSPPQGNQYSPHGIRYARIPERMLHAIQARRRSLHNGMLRPAKQLHLSIPILQHSFDLRQRLFSHPQILRIEIRTRRERLFGAEIQLLEQVALEMAIRFVTDAAMDPARELQEGIEGEGFGLLREVGQAWGLGDVDFEGKDAEGEDFGVGFLATRISTAFL